MAWYHKWQNFSTLTTRVLKLKEKMNELTERQRMILSLVMHEYVRTAVPVGSQHIVNHYRLDMSPATVRNELAALTDKGFLRQPHTSAGRAPTEAGYRYFVGQLLQETDLPDQTRRTITHQFYQMRHDFEEWMRLAASILAHQSKAASLVTAPHSEQARLKHLELISTRGNQVLMVMVMVGGEIRQRILTLTESYSQENLSIAADRLTRMIKSSNIKGVLAMRPQLATLEQDIIDVINTEMNHANSLASGEIYLDGMSNFLAEPEFSGTEDARKALHILEERSLLQDLLSRSAPAASIGGVQVLIGGEGTWEELSQCSIVLARYGVIGQATGTLGVLGPMRMSYGRSITTVRFLAGLLSELVNDSFVE
jgi:heat-inducible transcriptional repressor